MSAEPTRASAARSERGVRTTGILCATLALLMVGGAYASVPLYNLFCRVTGYDGTPLVGTTAPSRSLDRTVSIRFDTNVAPGLDWRFTAERGTIDAKVGETQTVFFRATNTGSAPSTGVAVFNVQPGQAGAFFVKLKCFCFEEQTLKPGESLDFPVVFYVDPSLADEHSLDGLSGITLSYTYFASRNGQPVAAATPGG